eukprot:9488769-Pyramimonas_sp.AAC.1
MISIADKFPTVLVRNVVDDVHAQRLGSPRFVAEHLGGAGRLPASGYKRSELVLATHKTHFIASSQELADALNQEWKEYGFVRKTYTRSLGTDSHTSKGRVLPTAGARFKKGIPRSFKLFKPKQTGAKLGSIQRAGPQATALWGSGVLGLSGRQLHHLRRAAAASLHVEKRCVGGPQ